MTATALNHLGGCYLPLFISKERLECIVRTNNPSEWFKLTKVYFSPISFISFSSTQVTELLLFGKVADLHGQGKKSSLQGLTLA